MNIIIFLVFTIIFQTVASPAMSQEMVYDLFPSLNSPMSTSCGVTGSLQCTKNSDESYAVCASISNIAIKYNLHPFSFAAKGEDQGNYMLSCDLYETASQSTSRAVCVKGYYKTQGIVYFHRVSDMITITTITIGTTYFYPHVIVDTPNQIAYVSNYNNPPAIYKISNIGSLTPIVVGNLTSFGYGDYYPAAMLIIDGFLYVHFALSGGFGVDPSRLGRTNITTFTWNKTVNFLSGESDGFYDNLVNDNNYIYDLTGNGILVRCTYKNNNFSRVDSLNTAFSSSVSLAISPDSSFLLLAAASSGVIVVNTSSFSVDSRALLPNPATGYLNAWGRPIILSKNILTNKYPVFAFSQNNDYLYAFNVSLVPFREAYPTISPLSSSPIKTSSGVYGSLQCTKNSDEYYAVCASKSNTAIKYNLQPFSFAAKGSNQGDRMISCDLYETTYQSTSRAVCVKGEYGKNGIVYFHRVSDMVNITNVSIGITGKLPHVAIDSPNQVVYVSNNDYYAAIFKITNIGSSTPIFAETLSSFGSGDIQPDAMIIIDGFLYAHFDLSPSRLARINVSTFTWSQTVEFVEGETSEFDDNLANDDYFVYYLAGAGILVRCTYKNNNFARFDRLKTGLRGTSSLAISPDLRTLFVVSNQNSLLQIVDVASFAMFGNVATVLSPLGRPIVMSSRYVYAFRDTTDLVYAFRYTNPTLTPSASVRRHVKGIASSSASSSQTLSSAAGHLIHSSPSLSPSSLSLIETLTPDAKARMKTRSRTQQHRREKNLKTRTRSLEDENKNVFIQKISESVASALVASDVTQAVAVVSVAVLGSISSSPVLGFNVGRQQAMTNFAKKSLEGDCRGLLPATTVNNFEEHISNPLGLGDSPTQMSIGGSEKLMSYYVGAVVGDFILTFGLVLLSQGIGIAVMKYFENKKNNNSNFGQMVRDRMGKKNRNSNNNNNKETTFEMMRRVFATSYVSLTLFFCLSFLLTPILSSSLIVLVAAMNDPKLKDHEVGVGLKILCVILAVIFCAVAVYFVVWSVFVRKQRKEKYRILKQEKQQSLLTKIFKAEGEWCFPNPTSIQQQNLANLTKQFRQNDVHEASFPSPHHNFLIAEPTFESYRDTIWFCSIEIISAMLLAFPPFFAQFSSSAKGSCLVQGIMLLIILLVYTVLLIWKNPFKLRILRIMNPILALQQLIIVLISSIMAGKRNSNDAGGESPSWLWKVIIIPLGFQGAMSFLMIGAAFFPFVLFLKKLKERMSRNEGHNDKRPKKNNLSAERVQSSRTTRRRHDDANEIELLPRQRTSSGHDHRERNTDQYQSRSRNQHPRSTDRENPRSSHHRGSQINSRGNERERSSSEIRNATNNNNRSNERVDHDNRSYREAGRNNSSNSNEQRDRDRCARTLHMSPSSLSPRRAPSNGPRDRFDEDGYSPRRDHRKRI